MSKVSCLCGAVSVTAPQRPEMIMECNCMLCSKTGARWGYFDPAQITVEGSTSSFRRTDKDDPSAEIHFCPTCGSTTHFVLTESAVAKHGNTMMGVNYRLADPAGLAGVELRFPDGRAWPGEGEFTYVRAPEVLGG